MSLRRTLSLVGSSWQRLFENASPVEIVRPFFGLFRDRPIAVYLTVLCIYHFHWINLLIIVLAFLFSQLLIEVFLKYRLFKGKLKVVRGCLNVYQQDPQKKTVARKYLVSEYIPNEYEDIETYFLQIFLGMIGIGKGFTIDNTVFVYHIKKEGTVNGNLTCYPGFLGSFIFFSWTPSEMKGVFQKFIFLHELAHACLQFTQALFFPSHCRKLYFVYFLFLWFLLRPHAGSWVVWSAFSLLILLGLIEKFVEIHNEKIVFEIAADALALTYLDEAETKRLNGLLSRNTDIFMDGELTTRENYYRLEQLKKSMELARQDKEDELIDSAFSKVPKPNFGLLLLSCLLVAVPAFYSKTPDTRLLWWLAGATFLLLFLFVFLQGITSALHRHIEDRLGEWG